MSEPASSLPESPVPQKIRKLASGEGEAYNSGQDSSKNLTNQESNESLVPLIIKPIETLQQLLEYGAKESERARILARSTRQLSSSFSVKYKMSLANGTRRKISESPKLIVCHDYRGGYGDDKYINGTCNPENYSFSHWLQTDIFIYFSHKLITIPPIGWINAAHSHGVKILGTIITENDDGKAICAELFKDGQRIDEVVENLCKINEDYMFDGYLVNIENPLENSNFLREFIDKLSKRLKESSAKNLVIYYDSIIDGGKLKWQNELNELNKQFFDVCDGIFLNYCWKDENLAKSIEIAGERSFDVFVGVDVFGRGCFGGGGLSTNLAVEAIANTKKLSTAIFAPAWSFECHPYKDYPKVDEEMWMNCAAFFNYKCFINNRSSEAKSLVLAQPCETTTLANSNQSKPNWSCKTLIATDFNRGYGLGNFQFHHDDDQVNQKPETISSSTDTDTDNKIGSPWFNLSKQSIQPLFYTCNKDLKCQLSTSAASIMDAGAYYCTESGFSGGGCLIFPKISEESEDGNAAASGISRTLLQPKIVYRICFPVYLRFPEFRLNERQFLALLYVWKPKNQSISIENAETQATQGKTDDCIKCGLTFYHSSTAETKTTEFMEKQSPKIIPIEQIRVASQNEESREKNIKIHLSHFISEHSGHQVVNATGPSNCPNLVLNFNKSLTTVTQQNGWNFSCDVLELVDLTQHGAALQAIYLGSQSSQRDISLGYFGLIDVTEALQSMA